MATILRPIAVFERNEPFQDIYNNLIISMPRSERMGQDIMTEQNVTAESEWPTRTALGVQGY